MLFIIDVKLEELRRALYKIPLEDLPCIHYELCRDRWPEVLGEHPGDVYYDTLKRNTLEWIREKCGIKSLLRWQKVEKEGYPPQMFEDWYDSNYIGGSADISFTKADKTWQSGKYEDWKEKFWWITLTLSIVALFISVAMYLI